MPCKSPEGLVLTVDPNVIHKVDTANAQNLFSMWTVFSRCADSVEQGRRLENLSWRLWNRETFCCETNCTETKQAYAATSLPKDIPDQAIPEVPQLSGSVDSIVEDEEVLEFSSESEPLEIAARPRIVRQDSGSSSSRGRERHITSENLEKLVVTIIQESEPNFTPLPEVNSPYSEAESDESQSAFSPDTQETVETPTNPTTEPMCNLMELPSAASPSHSVNSDAQSSSSTNSQSRTTVIRGFSPSHVSIPTLRLQSNESLKKTEPDVIPEPNSSPAPKPVQLKKQPAKFALGGSSGDESSPQSLEMRKLVAPLKKKMFLVGGSSGSGEDDTPSLKSAMHSSRPSSLLAAQKKQTSFSNQVITRTIQTPSDQSGSYMDESAIDDDEDDSDWEDSIEESGKSSVDDAVTFKRVPSKGNLTSQRSLISLMFAGGQDQRARNLGGPTSQSTSALPQHARSMQSPTLVASPNDSDDQGLEMKRGRNAQSNLRPTLLRPINEIPRSGAQPIKMNPSTSHQQAALSPRTTRRNMLATELTESLRRQLLWERQQKSSTANAVLKRRHTSMDVANLKQYPEKVYMNKGTGKGNDEANSSSWNQYFNRDTLGGYNAQGW